MARLLPWTRTTSTTRTLIGVGLTDGKELQCIHTDTRVEDLQLAVAGINHIADTVD